MKISINNWKEPILNFIEFLAYFSISIVILCSVGVWLPFAIDNAQFNQISEKTLKELPWNLITYSIAIVMVAFIDRLLFLFKITNKYKRNELEFLILLIVLFLGVFLVYKSYVLLKFNELHKSIYYSLSFTILAWILWIYVRVRAKPNSNFSTLGGEM